MRLLRLLLPALCAVSCAQTPDFVEWDATCHPQVIEILGAPQLEETTLGQAVRFDGIDDGVFLDSMPLAGLEEFTVEMIFNQDSDASFEQRFLHIGVVKGPRILFETRVLPDSTWYFDAFVHMGSKEESVAVIDTTMTHPCDVWTALAMTVSPQGIVSYVNGEEQGRSDLSYRPVISEGFTSVGVRQNKVCWFKGRILKLRITPRVLAPEEMMKVEDFMDQ